MELQLIHNIRVAFCGSSGNAEKMAEYILKKVNYLERIAKKDI